MPIFADATQMQRAEIADPDGNTVECFIVPVAVLVAEVEAELAEYDASNQYSPSASDSREIARVVLDELVRVRGAS